MKRHYLIIAIFFLFLTVVACGQNNDDGNSVNDGMIQDENPTNDQNEANDTINDEETGNADEMTEKMDELAYTDFELEVDYGSDQEFEAKIEQNSHGVKADLEDEISDIDVSGDEAFNILYPIVKKLSIDRNTSKEDAIAETLSAFDLPSDYVKFELELTFEDETKIEFEDKK